MTPEKPIPFLRARMDAFVRMLTGSSSGRSVRENPPFSMPHPSRRKKLKGWQRENRRKKNRWADS